MPVVGLPEVNVAPLLDVVTMFTVPVPPVTPTFRAPKVLVAEVAPQGYVTITGDVEQVNTGTDAAWKQPACMLLIK